MVSKTEQLIQALTMLKPAVRDAGERPMPSATTLLKAAIAQQGFISVLVQSSQSEGKQQLATLMITATSTPNKALPPGSVIQATIDRPLPKGALLIVKQVNDRLVIQVPKTVEQANQQQRLALTQLVSQLRSAVPSAKQVQTQWQQASQTLPTSTRQQLIQVLTGQPKLGFTPSQPRPLAPPNTPQQNLALVRQQTAMLAQPLRPAVLTALTTPAPATTSVTNTTPLSQFSQVLAQLVASQPQAQPTSIIAKLVSVLEQGNTLQQKASAMVNQPQQPTSSGQPLMATSERPEVRVGQLLNSLLQSQTHQQLQTSAINQQLDLPQIGQWFGFFQQQQLKTADFELTSETPEQGERRWRLKIYLTLAPLAEICAELAFTQTSLALSLWSQSKQTLQLLQAHADTLQALLNQSVGGAGVRCQYGMPPRQQTKQSSHQQVDVRA